MLGLRHFRRTAIDLFQGDITSFVCDAMVNAANESLANGDGVNGAIHLRGGPRILEACRDIGTCPTGKAVLTTAGDLPAQKVIHAVGPRWQGGLAGEAELLHTAYRSSLELAREHGLAHVAFPAISTGIYGYPIEAAASVALASVRDCLRENPPGTWRRITFVLYDQVSYKAYQQQLFALFPESDEVQP
jgi:O-acetyl-ADP-ribose deacetylase (regulator of RNase III)